MGTGFGLQALRNSSVNARFNACRSRVIASIPFVDPSLQRRIASGATWSIAGAGFASGLAMLSNVVCARLLGATRFGELAIVLSTTNLFVSLFTSGLSMTAAKYVAEHRTTDPGRAGTVIGLSSVVSAIVGAATALMIVAMAPWLSREILGVTGLAGALSLGAVVLFFGAVNGSQMGALSGLEAFDQIAFANLVRGAATVVFVTLGAAWSGIAGALLGYVAVGAVTSIFYQMAVRRECARKAIAISYRFDRHDLSILWRFTLPVLLTTLSFTPASWWSNVLLAKNSGYAETGVFNAVYQWLMLIQFFSSAVAGIALPMLSNVHAERDPEKYKRCLAVNFLLTSAPAIAIAIPVALCSRFIVKLYGSSFENGASALALISVAAVLSAMCIPVGHAIWSLEATVAAVLLALLRGVTLVAASYALAGRGAVGLAGANVIMGVVQTAASIPFMIWLLRRRFSAAASPQEPVLA